MLKLEDSGPDVSAWQHFVAAKASSVGHVAALVGARGSKRATTIRVHWFFDAGQDLSTKEQKLLMLPDNRHIANLDENHEARNDPY